MQLEAELEPRLHHHRNVLFPVGLHRDVRKRLHEQCVGCGTDACVQQRACVCGERVLACCVPCWVERRTCRCVHVSVGIHRRGTRVQHCDTDVCCDVHCSALPTEHKRRSGILHMQSRVHGNTYLCGITVDTHLRAWGDDGLHCACGHEHPGQLLHTAEGTGCVHRPRYPGCVPEDVLHRNRKPGADIHLHFGVNNVGTTDLPGLLDRHVLALCRTDEHFSC